MKRLCIILMVALTVVPLIADEPLASQAAPVAIVIDGIEFKDVSSDRVRMEVRSHVTASRKLKFKRVRFEQMRLENLPIYLSPIEEHLELEKGAAASLPRIPVTLYFRDLDSLDPLAQAVRDGKATVTGQARADLELNLLERVATHEKGAHADMPIGMTIPVETPGGNTGKTAALATLRAAQFALNLGGPALSGMRKSQRAWEDEMRARYAPSLVIAESRYSLRMRNNHEGNNNDPQADFVVRGVGFRISEDKFVLTSEMIEPWRYDADTATATQTGEASLIKESCDLLVWPGSEPMSANPLARSLSQGQIRVEHNSPQTEIEHIPVNHKNVKVKLLRRDSDANYAVLSFTRAEDKGTGIQLAPEGVRGSQNWDRLTLFRADDKGRWELVSTPAHRQDGRIVLEEAIDDRAFGSVLIAVEGAVGMVQEERAGMVLRLDWQGH
jgi:hypothetical protein